MEKRPVLGSLKLAAYIHARHSSITAFCDAHGLDRVQVQRLVNGDRCKRVTVIMAHLIHKATSGAVTYADWLPQVDEFNRARSAA